MASVEECRAAVEALAAKMAEAGPDALPKKSLDRSLSCHVPELGVTFTGHLHDGRIDEVTTEPSPPAQIRMTVAGADLLALTDGRLSAGHAFATGKLKIQASMMDLLRLRSMF
jgi:hypothetical protein